jgi:hypothetical protein
MKQDMLVGDLVQHVDDRCIGIIIGRRKKKYLGQDTLIIFFSDNKVEDMSPYYLRRLE